MIYRAFHSNLLPIEKTFDRIFEEVATVTGGGFETTANTMRLILYHVYTNDEILQRLRKELASLSAKHSEPIELKKLEQLDYLTAVLKKGLRLSPGIATRAARITDKDLFYNNWCIPAGTPIGMTTLLMHTDETLCFDPKHFNRDRWRNSADMGSNRSDLAPLSKGTRICLGMQ